MSYDCDRVMYASGKLFITHERLAQLYMLTSERPEQNMIDMLRAADAHGKLTDPIEIGDRALQWCSEGSGYTWDKFLRALKLTTGEAELVCIFERGDSVLGFYVKDGIVTKKKVRYQLY
jgi:hypothetical protein